MHPILAEDWEDSEVLCESQEQWHMPRCGKACLSRGAVGQCDRDGVGWCVCVFVCVCVDVDV